MVDGKLTECAKELVLFSSKSIGLNKFIYSQQWHPATAALKWARQMKGHRIKEMNIFKYEFFVIESGLF